MRRERYRVRTQIDREGGQPVVRRVVDHPDALPFLTTIVEREQLAERFYAGHAGVVTGTLRDDVIEYPFLPFPSLEQEIGDHLLAGEPDQALELVRKYLLFLDTLPSSERVPRELLASLGASETSCRCFEAGPLDCIPRNILVDGEAWHIIDHEWMFEYPIPVDLVRFIGVTTLAFGQQDPIRQRAAPGLPVEIFAGRRQRFFAPVEWLDLLDELTLDLELLNGWHAEFQRQVLLDCPPCRLRGRGRHYTQIPHRLHPSALASDIAAVIKHMGAG